MSNFFRPTRVAPAESSSTESSSTESSSRVYPNNGLAPAGSSRVAPDDGVDRNDQPGSLRKSLNNFFNKPKVAPAGGKRHRSFRKKRHGKTNSKRYNRNKTRRGSR